MSDVFVVSDQFRLVVSCTNNKTCKFKYILNLERTDAIVRLLDAELYPCNYLTGKVM